MCSFTKKSSKRSINLAGGFNLTLTLQIPSAPLWGKQGHFLIYNTQNISCILFFCVCPPAIVFLKNGKMFLAVQTNQITKGILKMKLFCICIKWKIQTEDIPLSICFLSITILQNKLCVERGTWCREEKQEADLRWWRICMPSCSSVS